MKKIISLLLSIVMLLTMILNNAFISYAMGGEGFYDKEIINYNETYSSSSTLDKHIPCANAFRYHIYQFYSPAQGKIIMKMSSKNSNYFNIGTLELFSANNTDIAVWNSTINQNLNYDKKNKFYYTENVLYVNKGIYYLVIEYYVDDIDFHGSSYNVYTEYKADVLAPSTLKVSSRSTNALKVSWGKVGGVSGYQLQRKSGDSWKTVANTTSANYTVKSLKAGTTYNFRVRAYKTINGTKYYSGWRTLKTPTSPSKPAIKTPSTNKKHQITAKWKKVSACSGYQVQFSTSNKFKKATTKTVSGASKTSCTGKFKKGKKYYIRVRSYKTVDGKKYYSAWSSVKSIKCKS